MWKSAGTRDPRDPPSSAWLLARSLVTEYGITRDAICGRHLAAFYESLNRVFPDGIERPVDDAFIGLPADPEPSAEPFWGVIIETREHPALFTVLSNVLERCNVPVQLFHGRGNRDFIRGGPIAGLVDAGRVVLTQLNLDSEIGLGYYNRLLLSPRLWQQFKSRGKLLFFQTDALCCAGSSFTLSDFAHYDYIGSGWARQRPVGLLIDGGSGGFSLRDWSRAMECLRRFPATRWPAGEDGYFSFHLDLMGARVAGMREAAGFSTQDFFTHRSFGCHQIGRLRPQELQAFLAYCPEALEIFPHLSERSLPPSGSSGDGAVEPSTTEETSKGPMFISNRYELIFFEVPRTGSNSITQLLNRIDPDSPSLEERRRRGGGWSYHYVTELAGEFPHYRFVAAHRNPYARLWSFWKHRRHGGNPEIFRSLSWKRYIDWVCNPEHVPEVEGAMPDIPITEMLDVQRVTHWLDFHRLDESWQRLAGETGMPKTPLPRVNASPDHGDMYHAFDEPLAMRIAERFAADFEHFGYDTASWQPGTSLEAPR